MSHRIKAMSETRYISLEKRIIEMGKMVGGWIKSEKAGMEKTKSIMDKKEKLL